MAHQSYGLQVADLEKMAMKSIFCILALVVASLAVPIDQVQLVPEKHDSAQVNVKPPLLSVPPAQITVHEKKLPFQQEQQQQEVLSDPQVAVQEFPTAPVAEVQAGEEGPNLLKGVEQSEDDKSDLETANSWGWGWGRRGYGGWGGWGGYYRPYYGYRGWGGHGWGGHGYGHGWGRGYGGWGGYGIWG